jgi:hypothetical protein
MLAMLSHGGCEPRSTCLDRQVERSKRSTARRAKYSKRRILATRVVYPGSHGGQLKSSVEEMLSSASASCTRAVSSAIDSRVQIPQFPREAVRKLVPLPSHHHPLGDQRHDALTPKLPNEFFETCAARLQARIRIGELLTEDVEVMMSCMEPLTAAAPLTDAEQAILDAFAKALAVRGTVDLLRSIRDSVSSAVLPIRGLRH